MALPAFKDQFKGIKISDLPGGKILVKKDGGTVDAITAATISSRAFCDAVNRADAINKKGGENEPAQ
jgi:electron transport complex protein RnfG